jgi:hypothetical protein
VVIGLAKERKQNFRKKLGISAFLECENDLDGNL